MAISARGRLKQVENWLKREYVTPFPVYVVFRRKVGRNGQDFASTTRRRDKIWVSMWTGLLVWPDVAIKILLHEWAHVLAWRVHMEDDPTEHDHPDEWGLWVARLERDFFDYGGYEDALEMPSRPWK